MSTLGHMPTILAVFVMVCASSVAIADAPYTQSVQLGVESTSLLLEHTHDWGAKSRETIVEKRGDPRTDPFSPLNTYGTIRLRDRSSGLILFEAPSPAFTHLWISADESYLVALSNLRVWNPYQAVVYDRSGQILVAASIGCESWPIPGCRESTSNFVYWFDEKDPALRVIEDEEFAVLVVKSPSGLPVAIVWEKPEPIAR